MTQSCFSTDFPSTWLAAIAATYTLRVEGDQPLLQEGQHGSDRALPGVFSVRRAPFDEQVPLKDISISRRWRSRQSDGVNYLLVP